MGEIRIVVADPSINAFDKSFQNSDGQLRFGGQRRRHDLGCAAYRCDPDSAWEQFRMNDLSLLNSGATYYELYTIGKRDVTRCRDREPMKAPIHTDATNVGTWEEFRPVKCGDLGSGIEYFIIPNAVPFDGWALSAPGGGGQVSDAVATGYGGWPESRFKLIRQPDGTYALQTSNGVNFVTALGGGGEVQEYIHCHPGFPAPASTASPISSTPMRRRF